jgi:hypothetical protein
MDENYLFEYDDLPLTIFENIILDKHGNVHLIHQNPNKEITLFTGNKNEKTMKNFQKLLNVEKIIITRIHSSNSME